MTIPVSRFDEDDRFEPPAAVEIPPTTLTTRLWEPPKTRDKVSIVVTLLFACLALGNLTIDSVKECKYKNIVVIAASGYVLIGAAINIIKTWVSIHKNSGQDQY